MYDTPHLMYICQNILVLILLYKNQWWNIDMEKSF